ncbi:hypothetical protein UFOVP462_16 [uncultured Caudovirales phage]|uniref:Uncharacterized protein n=1 Tax=uncultured Caudovirales phage TaxID=2100421 RepID=A0A6J5MBX0_9CAUD|nr:hypothetical protein UFOVP462_16 [uncultured Caudovirales phage]
MGLKYTSSFDAIRTQNQYTLEIYQESYDGSPIPVILAATPVVQEWQEDDPLAPIKGSTLTINLTTSGGLSLLDFYSDNDNEFNVKFIEDTTSTTLFEGYILQDDCSEVQVDFVHEITLTASDNLGTIKDINLGRAAELFGDTTITASVPCVFNPAGPYIIIDYGPEWPVQPGQIFTIDGTPFTMVSNLGEIDGVYTGWCIQIVENIPTLVIGTFDVAYNVPLSLDGYIPLIIFIKLCLKATYLNLPLSVINHITPTDGEIFLDTGETRMFEDVTLLGNTFLKNNEYMSCYDVLEIIMKRFNMSCFQAHNSWWIVRYPDLFLDYEEGETIVDYYKYDASTFNYIDKYTINKSYIIASGNYVETGLLKSIIRPYRRTLETFNYVQPEDLLCNSQFTDLGPLRQVTTGGGFTNKEYDLPCWYNYDVSGPYPDRFIRVVFEGEREVERYVVVTGNNFDDSRSVQSEDIELNAGDIIDYTFQFRTDVSEPGSVNTTFAIRIKDGTSTKYLQTDGSWGNSIGFVYNTPAGANTNEWQTVNIKSTGLPFNAIMNVYLAEATASPSDQTWYKDLRLTISWFVAGQGQINGHTHTASQSKTLNNVNDVDISIDNSRRSSIAGTLFLTTSTGLFQDKCTTWQFGYGYNTGTPAATYQNLGQLVTSTYMFQRYIPRSKYNGNLLSIRNANGVLSNLAIFSNEFIGPALHNKMLLGSLAIDYRNDSAQFTMWEVFNSEFGYIDNFTDFTSYLYNILYEFNYLYENN